MPILDVVDEALIDADPATVYRAVVDEFMGRTRWAARHVEEKPRGLIPPNRVGGLFDVTVHRFATPRSIARTTEVTEDKLWRVEYIGGDVRGEGLWTFEPVEGKTRVSFRYRVRPKRWLFRLLAPFVDFGKLHSGVMQAFFAELDRFVKANKAGMSESEVAYESTSR